MALLNQDFIKFYEDTFQIRFTITDATVSLVDYEAWWGVGLSATGTTSVIEKASDNWSTTEPLSTITGITMGVSSVVISLNQEDFGEGKLQPGQTYYHELVLSASGDEEDSVVVASGEFTVNPSLFTNRGYRP